jgi:hypothetical protein
MYGHSRSTIDPEAEKLDAVPPKTGETSLGSEQRSDLMYSIPMWMWWDRDGKDGKYR